MKWCSITLWLNYKGPCIFSLGSHWTPPAPWVIWYIHSPDASFCDTTPWNPATTLRELKPHGKAIVGVLVETPSWIQLLSHPIPGTRNVVKMPLNDSRYPQCPQLFKSSWLWFKTLKNRSWWGPMRSQRQHLRHYPGSYEAGGQA